MSSSNEEVKFRMKVLINKEKNKVLFAEVDHDLADILISFLTLPLGTMVRLLSEHYGDEAPVIGSLNTLYKGLVDLDRSSFCTKLGKQMLIKPKNPFEDDLVKLKVNIDDTEPTMYFTCEVCSWNRLKPVINYSMYDGTTKCACGKLMSSIFQGSKSVEAAGGFTTETASFIITDDLQIAAATTTTTTTTSKNMTVKAIIQKSTGKILVAQAMEDFVDFVFSLLTIPLGGALSLLGGDFSVGSIHNLHRSLSNLDGDRYLKSPNPFKTPQLPPKYLSKHQVFPLTEKSLPPISKHQVFPLTEKSLPPKYLSKHQVFPLTAKSPYLIKSFILLDPKGQGSYVKGPATFMVTDDLVVTKSSAISGLSILHSLDIPTSDTEEYVIDIGMEEGLSILRASLLSTSALSNGLEPFLKKRFKKPKLKK
ncbi:hypothetical protein ACJIZ3_002530 [Penstemon smallii]|uniref:DUF674 domain-containing protein n=1 Tax=Penstemon smallii TaxID=265156 RepID=A0ABD3U7U2_9LAMI